MGQVKVRNYNLDALKMICAAFVVIIHVPMWGAGEVLIPIARCAVPCFFMISGFCIYNDDKTKMEAGLGRSIKHILRILLWSSSIYFLLQFIHVVNHGEWDKLFCSKAWTDLLLFNDPSMILGSGIILWYLYAYLYVLLVVRLFLKMGKMYWLKLFIPFLLIGNLILGTYSLMILGVALEEHDSRNFLFMGLPFFTLGMYIKEHFSLIKNYKGIVKWSWAGFVLFSIITIIEVNGLTSLGLHPKSVSGYIGAFFASISLFLVFAIPQNSNKSWLSILGRQDSLYVYVFHILVTYPLFHLRKILGEWSDVVYQYCGAIIVLILTILMVRFVRWSWNKILFKFR